MIAVDTNVILRFLLKPVDSYNKAIKEKASYSGMPYQKFIRQALENAVQQ